MLKEELESFAQEHDVPILMEEAQLFLLKYIKEHGAHNILEVGTAIAYTSIAMAKLNPQIQIDTIEKKVPVYQEAVKNVQAAGLMDQIHLYLVDAIHFQSQRTYDLIFIDGPKSQYGRHMKHFEPNLRSGGAFLFDNMEFHGFVAHPETTNNRNTKQMARKLARIRREIEADPLYHTSYYPDLGDGILLAVKH